MEKKIYKDGGFEMSLVDYADMLHDADTPQALLSRFDGLGISDQVRVTNIPPERTDLIWDEELGFYKEPPVYDWRFDDEYAEQPGEVGLNLTPTSAMKYGFCYCGEWNVDCGECDEDVAIYLDYDPQELIDETLRKVRHFEETGELLEA